MSQQPQGQCHLISQGAYQLFHQSQKRLLQQSHLLQSIMQNPHRQYNNHQAH